jgi:hypothetical protein
MSRYSGSLVVLAAALLLPLGAAAADAPKDAPPAASTTAKPAKAATDKSNKVARDERQCSMPSSPRLQKKGDDCADAKERTRWHSKDDLNSTGQMSTADALRQLDPSVH